MLTFNPLWIWFVNVFRGLALATFALVTWAAFANAQPAKPLALDGVWSDDETTLELTWEPQRGTFATVFRRELGQIGNETWIEQTPLTSSRWRVVLGGLHHGKAYEFQVRLSGLRKNDPKPPFIGYWSAGHRYPAATSEGAALVVVDGTLLPDLDGVLGRFQNDLIGAGWRVSGTRSPRGGKSSEQTFRDAFSLRAKIQKWAASNAGQRRVVILVGHVPVVKTGWVAPDGHERHAVPSDLFYADLDGEWPLAQSPDGKTQLKPSTIPSDHIELEIGRIDFSNLGDTFPEEKALLQAYFDKNHAWRTQQLGDIRKTYGQNKMLQVELNALRNITGPDNVVTGGHHNTAGQGPYLFGIDFGHYDGLQYLEKPHSEAIFALNFGSFKHVFTRRNNPMVALMGLPTTPLAVGWGARPAWHLHGMALGESIGQAHKRTVNNGRASDGGFESRAYALTGQYDWINPPWVNLLGDPTLQAFGIAPVQNLTLDADHQLTWTLPQGADSVILYRSTDANPRDFEVLNGGQAVKGTTFKDTSAKSGSTYMVRARGLVSVYAGSIFRLSQGAFVRLDQ